MQHKQPRGVGRQQHCVCQQAPGGKHMLRRLARQTLLPTRLTLLTSASSSGSSSRAATHQQLYSSLNDSHHVVATTSSSSDSLDKAQAAVKLLEQSIAWEVDAQCINAKGKQQSFSQYAGHALTHLQQLMAEAAAPSTGAPTATPLRAPSPPSSSSGQVEVRANLLRYAELMQRYDSYTHSQRQKLLEAVRDQLLPQVNVLVGRPVLPAVSAQHTVAASHVVPQDRPTQELQQEEQHQEEEESPQQPQQQQQAPQQRRQTGPRLPSKLAELNRRRHQPQQQQQQQPPFQAAGAAIPAVEPSDLQQQQAADTVPSAVNAPVIQQQQQQQPVPRRRIGPPRPGAKPPSTSPPNAAAAGGDGGSAMSQPQQQFEQQPEQQQLQPVQQPQQQQAVLKPRRPHTPGPRGTLSRTQSAPADVWRPDASSAAAPPSHTAPPPTPQQAPSSSSSSSAQAGHVATRTPAAGPGTTALKRTTSAAGPYPIRRHLPYPAGSSKTAVSLQQLNEQQQQNRQLPPAWQLYFPLPEELGGPAAHTVAAAAVAAPPAMAASHALLQQVLSEPGALSSSSEADSSSDSDDSAATNGSSSGKSKASSSRNKALTEEKWRALVASAWQYKERVDREQQRAQQEAAGQLKQRMNAWLQLRESRLTGSALANMLCWFDGPDKGAGDHVRLWKEKLGLQRPPPPNEKMLYGTRSEHLALSSYQALSPQEVLREMGFALWGSDGAHDWLAASPDGLISSAGLSGLATITTSMAALSSSTAAAGAAAGGGEGSSSSSVGAAGVSEEVAAWVKQQTGTSLDGVLEIKCPYKASPLAASPYLPKRMDPYYMPQVQVLCEVLQREWAVVFYWSETQGSHMTLVHRDREYFGLLWRAMADFWWRHLIPAKLMLEADPSAVSTVEQMYSPRMHPYRAEIIRRSKAMVQAAPQRTFTPEETFAPAGADVPSPPAMPEEAAEAAAEPAPSSVS